MFARQARVHSRSALMYRWIAVAIGVGLLTAGGAALPGATATAASPPAAAGYFQVLAPGSALPTDSQCAAQVHQSAWEPRAANQVANSTIVPQPNTMENFSQWSATWNTTYKPRIDGDFSGTTDEIIQWVACKWGWSDNLVRAEAVVESNWYQGARTASGAPIENEGFGDYTTNAAQCAVGYTPPCPTSFGIVQVKWFFHPGDGTGANPPSTSPLSSFSDLSSSTAFNLDEQVAEMRGCYDGMSTYLGNTRGNLWGCIQSWFSGAWSPNGGSYSKSVQSAEAAEAWLTWPDQSSSTTTTTAPTTTTLPPTTTSTTAAPTTTAATTTSTTAASTTTTAAPTTTAVSTTTAATTTSTTAVSTTTAASTTSTTLGVVPSAPQGLSGKGGNGSVALSWSPPADPGSSSVTSYNVYRGTSTGGEDVTPVATGLTTTSFTDLSPTNGTPYFYEVTALNLTGEGGRSNETSATPHRTVVGDFDGNGTTDIGVFRPDVGGWYIDGQTTTFDGLTGDIPVPGDYDGVGHAEQAVFRPSVGGWYINGHAPVFFGLPGDIPVPGDYNGDGTTDIAVYRPSVGGWYITINGVAQPPVFFGLPGDIPVPGDYNGDGTTDLAVYRPSVGGWYVMINGVAQPPVFFGNSTDIPVPGDYNGDGTTDIAVYRSGAWLINGQPTVFLGLDGDIPVPGDYNGDGITDPAVFRPDVGGWYINGQPTIFWGLPGDTPTPERPGT